MAEKSLLQSIREKELETNVSLDTARREAAELVETARREAAAVVEKAEKESTLSSEEYTRIELEKARREVEVEKEREIARARQDAEAGEAGLPRAVKRITKAVIPD